MSKLVERLASLMDGGGGIFLETDLAQELLAHIEQLEANQIPDGCVVVPREPTDEMIDAGCEAANFYRVDLMNAYVAMIQVATRGEGE